MDDNTDVRRTQSGSDIITRVVSSEGARVMCKPDQQLSPRGDADNADAASGRCAHASVAPRMRSTAVCEQVVMCGIDRGPVLAVYRHRLDESRTNGSGCEGRMPCRFNTKIISGGK